MSDIWELDQKVKEGSEWRGTREVSLDDSLLPSETSDDTETFEVEYRLLLEPEFSRAVNKMGADKFENKLKTLKETRSVLDEDEQQRFRELQTKDDDLTEDEQEELSSIKEKFEEEQDGEIGGLLGMMDPDLTDGFHYAAACGLEPDEEDIDEVMDMTITEQEDKFGEVIQTREKAEELAQERIKNVVIGQSTGFTAYMLGMDIFMESMEGHSGN